MAIESKETLLHWNYFLALESDLEKVSRYIEFTKNNYDTYSVELAHLLLASSSEVDVVMKALCKKEEPQAEIRDINDYKKIVRKKLPEVLEEKVFINRYSLTLHPWVNWKQKNAHPDWWHSYNKVKHERSNYFQKANLKNVLNAMAGLLVIVFYFYKIKYFESKGYPFNKKEVPQILLDNKEVTQTLRPETTLFTLSKDYYHELLWH